MYDLTVAGKMSKSLELFDAYLENLIASGKCPPTNSDSILCPLCLTSIRRIDVEEGRVSLEHIVPQHATAQRQQKTPETRLGNKTTRSGVTLTCTACNGKKGRELDWIMRDLIGPGSREEADYPRRAGVAILIYAYLLAFSTYGYEYILAPGLETIREQFQEPDSDASEWLQHAEVDREGRQPIVATEQGGPSVVRIGGDGPLKVFFWRFRSLLPPVGNVIHPVRIPASLTDTTQWEG